MNSIMSLKEADIRGAMKQSIGGIGSVILDKELTIKLAMTCLLAKGHLLLEDIPGTGKTVLALAIARVCGLDYKRVQFTNDLLPADIMGVSIFDRNTSAFSFHKGPIFSELFLADEINRATPKSQSALLEAMEERQVSIEGKTRKLTDSFFVIATQNPLEQQGVYPLPEAQLDRFLMRLSLGYVSKESELALLAGKDARDVMSDLPISLSGEDLQSMQIQVDRVNASPALLEYIHSLLDYTRTSGQFINGLSTRAGLGLLRAARAWAFLHDREHVLPSDVQSVFSAVATHRLANVTDGPMKTIGQSTDPMQAVLDAVSIP